MVFEAILGMIAGALAGSYAAALAHRLPRKERAWSGSRCLACKHALGFRDQIPLAGWLLLRGRCRYCGSRISPRYLVAESAGAAVALLGWTQLGFTLTWAAFLVLEAFLLAAALIDLETRTIPDALSLRAALAGIVFAVVQGQALSGLAGMFAAALPLTLAAVIRPGGIGGGDIKLSAAAGLFLNLTGAVYALLIASAARVACGLLRRTSGKPLNEEIPFAPMLAFGFLIQFCTVWR